MTSPDALRARLLALRAAALAQLAAGDAVDSGLLRPFADAGAALAAINTATVAVDAALALACTMSGPRPRLQRTAERLGLPERSG